jgi:glycosyltransferase involved in cell wall biosynthesis
MQKIMRKFKVLHLIEDFKTGGLERIVEILFNGLNQDEYEVSIWCIAAGGEIADKFIREGKDIRILNLKTYHNPLNIFRLALLIKKNRFQIVHTHGYFAGTMGRISAFLARTPVIISHVHTTYLNFSKRNLWVEKVLSRITDRIICCANTVEDFLISHEKLDPKKLVTIYNGICCKREEGWNVRGNRIGPNGICIVIVASLVENKGHRYLFEALSKIVKTRKNIRLRVVGDGPLKFQLSDYSKSLGINEYTEFLGIRDNVQAILKNSDILVLPSIEREGLGIALVEAMCQGKPVIGTNIGGIPEVIEDGVNGYLVNPRDSDVLAEKLDLLINDEDKRKRMGIEGRKRFEERFDANIMIKKTEKLYESLLKQKYLRVSRILYLHNIGNISGGERSLINLWKNLDSKRYWPHLIIPEDGLLGKEARGIGLKVDHCKVPQLRASNQHKILEALFILGRYCKKEKINIIHSYTPRNNIMASLIGSFLGIPVIWHERNLIFGDETDISRKFLFMANRVICNSQAIAERFRKKGKIPPKVRVVLNGVNLDRFRPGKINPNVAKKYNINGRKVVGLISNLDRRKMPEYLLDACPYILERCPNTVFFIVGGEFGEEDRGRKQELEEKAKKSGIGGSVIFTGFLSDVTDVIQAFDVGVAVTEKEACSRAIIEMMACGKPVVAFNTGGNPELIDDGVTGTLVYFGDIESFATAVSDILENDEKRERMGMQARQRAEKCFDVRTNARKTQAIYSKLMGYPALQGKERCRDEDRS